jgi:hypothetical protein
LGISLISGSDDSLALNSWVICQGVQNEAGAHDGGGGDCEADEREATGSTRRGGYVTQEQNSVSDNVLL